MMTNFQSRWQLLATFIFLATKTTCCQGQSREKWPPVLEKWLPGMEIITYHGGGMMPESRTARIKDLQGSYIHWRMPKTDTLVFVLSKLDLNDLVKEINDIHFRDMNSSQTNAVAHDKPTTSIELIWSGKSHKVSDGATTNITEGDATAFFKLYNYIETLIKNKTGKQAN